MMQITQRTPMHNSQERKESPPSATLPWANSTTYTYKLPSVNRSPMFSVHSGGVDIVKERVVRWYLFTRLDCRVR